ncbi:pseudouridine synthase deg1 [Entomophthora muscae]|uniref:Pseudouridine synthase deg1 n=1 Tax=Entomophthora muscae TaxID=34485 RepID=A0ACC2SK96_9FUNG|nr:pseudouridine synthase deg1 [Entomophthora muscae]
MIENTSTTHSRDELEKLSKEQLIDILLSKTVVDSVLGEATTSKKDTDPPSVGDPFLKEHVDPTTKTKAKPKVKVSRPFDISKYQCRPIALKVFYLGWNYMGLASQGENSCALPLAKSSKGDITTIEDYIFSALVTCRLIADAKNVDLSRCGRTDKGVSGLCQVLVISLRSALSKEQLEDEPLMVDGELTYIDMINKSLPEDIRVLSWAPAPSSFNARFDCKSRSYKYFFTTHGTELDVERMKEACNYLVGTHDYRNFCRQDGSKQLTSFVRDIFEAQIQSTDISYPGTKAISSGAYEVFIRGSGFLWHQIRCIMAVLFRIGQGLELPSLVKSLLDIEQLKQKPVYELACPYPLVLFDCTYDIPLNWQVNSQSSTFSLLRVYRSIYTQWYESLTKAYHFSNVLRVLDQGQGGLAQLLNHDSTAIPVIMGGGSDNYVRRYIPIMKRPRSAPVEVTNKKYLDRKLAKLESKKHLEADENGSNASKA